ncbi:MAG: OB-fold nucleic acid binding domain-containing protein, partial [Acidobacteriota bacterium]
MLELSTAIQFVKGVGPIRAGQLQESGIQTVEDLLLYRPFRYEDRTNFRLVRDAREGSEVVLRGKIVVSGGYRTRRRGLSIFEAVLRDESGKVHLTFFNQPYLADLLTPELPLIVFGVVKRDRQSGTPVLINPEFEIVDEDEESIHAGRIVPVYRRMGKLQARWLRRTIHQILEQLSPEIPEPLPRSVREKFQLVDRRRALAGIHFPDKKEVSLEECNQGQTEFHRRLCFEEFFLFQLGVQLMKQRRLKVAKVRSLRLDQAVRDRIKEALPFRPTSAQKRALKEIVDDMASTLPMHRILQGDVGCGKTLVA